jgi:AraC family transcriptional regulator
MYLQEFPDLTWLKHTINKRFSDRKDWLGNPLVHEGWPSVVLNVKTSQSYRDNITGPVSLFGNISGESYVKVENREVLIPAGYFFITNEGQEYTLRVEKPTETFNVHFGTYFVKQTLESISNSDFESTPKGIAPEFRNRLIPFTDDVKSLIGKIKSSESNMAEQENLHAMLCNLLQSESDVNQVSVDLVLAKSSTREEIMKRLLQAVDYLYATSNKDLSLDELAREACMSKFHFLRLFRTVFQKTPHQFLLEVRINKAKELLKSRSMAVNVVGRQTGFNSPVSFNRAFVQSVGVSPSRFQQL